MSDHKISQSEYWRQIKAIVRDAKRESKEVPKKDRDERVQELITQAVDGHMWIIYTWAYPWVLMHTRNEDALFDSQGEQTFDSYSKAMQLMAFAAMEQDCYEVLNEK